MATALKIPLTFNEISNADPTYTRMIRRAFVAEVNKRFRRLKGAIRKAIVDQDCFGLQSPSLIAMDVALSLPRERQFAFTRSADKVQAFMDWLDEAEKAEILEVVIRPGIRPGVEGAWTDRFIRSAYQRGIARARTELRNAGRTDIPSFEQIPGGISAVFNQPFHADRVGLLYTRCFSELKGIDQAMDQAISRSLAESIAEGRNPRQIARILNKRVDAIGITRARTMARTEVIRAHHVASIQEYRHAGVEDVTVIVEWLTAGYNVCPVCQELEGRTFTLDEIEPMIPRHPNCRCASIPAGVGEWPHEFLRPEKETARERAAKKAAETRKRKAKLKAVPPKAKEPDIGLADDIVNRLEYQPGTQLGSNPGGMYKDPQTGKQYYIKFYADPDQARTEWAVNRIYNEWGIETPKSYLNEMPRLGGETKALAHVTEWEKNLTRVDWTPRNIKKYSKELAKIHQASAMVANWDVVGLEFDNLVLNKKTKKLFVIDSGGSLRFRAQGASKPFTGTPEEIKSLLNTRYPAGKVFSKVYEMDVFLEEDGARGIWQAWNKRTFDNILIQSGIKNAKELSEALAQRIEYMIDRYNLDGRHNVFGPEQGKWIAKFRKLKGGERWPDIKIGEYGSVYTVEGRNEMRLLAKSLLEKELKRELSTDKMQRLQYLFNSEWSSSSQSRGGMVLKYWAKHIKGIGGSIYPHQEITSLKEMYEAYAALYGGLDNFHKALQIEYEFNQYILRRLHGYDKFKLWRGCGLNEMRIAAPGLRNGEVGNYMNGNPVISSSARRSKGFIFGSTTIEIDARIEDVLKVYYQGSKWMHYGPSEAEYILIGNRWGRQVRRIR